MKNILVIFIALSFGLIGCADTGNKSLKYATESKVQAQIKEGVTTKDQVKAMFGSPYKTSYTDNGSLIWTYQYDDTSALTPETVGSVLLTLGLAGTKSKGTRNELVILFDEKNIVKKFNMSNSEIETGTILFTK
tara:strand:+ start:310 stop:711 length:402 start_codon:yes stop_codon:yes gene_type:complete